MYPTGGYERMMNDLYFRECENGTDIPITVAVLIADYRRQYARENIFNYLEQFNENTGKLIDFYIPGYCVAKDVDDHYNDFYDFKGEKYYFSNKLYTKFIRELNKNGITTQNQTELIIAEYSNNYLDIKGGLYYNLEADEKNGQIKSAKDLIDELVIISKQTTEFRKYKIQLRTSRLQNSAVRFIKEKLADYIFSKVVY